MNEQERQKAREVGDRIRQARKEAGGMKQRELADLLGVVERSMVAYETGEILPYRHLTRLEEIFGRPVVWFLHGEEDHGASGGELVEIRQELEQIRAILDDLVKLAKEK